MSDRDCNKCLYATRDGVCASWDCNYISIADAEPKEEHPEAAEGDRKLIDADRLIIDILDSPKIETNTIPGLIKIIYKQPAVEAEPKRGRWIEVPVPPHNIGLMKVCSVCGTKPPLEEIDVWTDETRIVLSNYCPNCGAKMDKK